MTIELVPSELSVGRSLAELVAASRVAVSAPIAGAEAVAQGPLFIADPIDTAIASYGHRLLETRDSITVQPTSVYRLTDAVVLGSDAVVMLDGVLVRDTVRHLPFWHPDSAIAAVPSPDAVTLRAPMPVELDGGTGPVLLGCVPAWRNHAHWLQECLPKLAWFLALRPRVPGLRLAVPRTAAGAVPAETLRVFGIAPADTVLLDTGKAVAFPQLLLLTEADLFAVPSLVPITAAALAHAAAAEVARVEVPGPRIYIHRTVEARPVANFAELRPLLEHYKFAVVAFENMTLIEQIATMQSARYVIAEHGAGLVNILFCAPQATVLEMFNPACAQPAFRVMALAGGHRYGFLVGTHVPTPRRPKLDWNSAYAIAPARLEEAIRAMLGEEAAVPFVATQSDIPAPRSAGQRGTMELAGPVFASPAEAVTLLVSIRKLIPLGEIETLSRVIRLTVQAFPNEVAVVHTAGVGMCDAGRVDDGMVYFNHALDIDPSFPYTALEVASLAGKRDEIELARYWYGVAMYGDPFLVRACFLAARFEISVGARRRARVLLERARRLAPEMPEIGDELAKLDA